MESLAFAPYIFLSVGKQLANGKIASITSAPETEYDERQRQGAPKQAEPRAASIIARSSGRLIGPEEDSSSSLLHLTAVRH